MMPKTLPFNLPFEAAAALFRRKVPLTREQFDQLADAAKLRAFTVAAVTRADILQDLMNAVQAAIDDGITLADFRSLLDDVIETRGWSGTTPWHAETVLRTNVQSAYGAGRLEQQRAQTDTFPFLLYDAIDDDRVRASHAALDGTVHAVSDPFWRTHYPPWGYNCRCHAESLTTEEAQELGIEPVNLLTPEPDPNGFTSPGASDEYRPNLSRLEPGLRDAAQRAIDGYRPED